MLVGPYRVIYDLKAPVGQIVTVDDFLKLLNGTGATLNTRKQIFEAAWEKGTWIAQGTATKEQIAELRKRGLGVSADGGIVTAAAESDKTISH